jgi:hypothetical protein
MQKLTVTFPLLMPLDVWMAAMWGEAKLQLVDFVLADPMVGEYVKYRFLIESECSRRSSVFYGKILYWRWYGTGDIHT